MNLLRLVQVLQETPRSADSRTAESTFLAVSLRFVSSCWTVERGMPGILVNVAAANFPVTSRYAGVVRIFLLLDHVDPVVHFANLASVKKSKQPWKLVNFWEKLLRSLHAYRFLNTNRRL